MTPSVPTEHIRGVMPVIPCRDLDSTLAFFREQLGFRIELISPADSPTTVVLSGHGTSVRLQRTDADVAPGTLHLLCDDLPLVGEVELVAPNGTRIEWIAADPPVVVPALHQSFVVSRMSDSAGFGTGRAGMQYRDLVPDRQGGRFIASHIRIPEGGPVPDYVHFHKVRFQMIFVRSGWVRVIYEDQGESFVMEAGDCVLQPPTIRHRVLESSDNLEVIEIGCPADHDTIAEHTITLPTGQELPEREYGGQLFVRHRASEARWTPFRFDGFVQQDLGIGSATHGLAGARVVRPENGDAWPLAEVPNEFLFTFVLTGSAHLTLRGQSPQVLEAGDSFVIPSAQAYALERMSLDCRLLEVSLPAELSPQVV